MASASDLPYELVLRILEDSQLNRPDVQSAGLVCRGWLAPAQEIYYKLPASISVHHNSLLYSRPSPRAIRRQHDQLKVLSQSLTVSVINPMAMDSPDWQEPLRDEVQHMLDACPALERLAAIGDGSLLKGVALGLRYHPDRIKSLHLTWTHRTYGEEEEEEEEEEERRRSGDELDDEVELHRGRVGAVEALLKAVRRDKCLRLENVDAMAWGSAQLPPRLESLLLDATSSMLLDIPSFFFAASTLANLTFLDIDCVEVTAPSFSYFATLHHLAVGFPFGRSHETVDSIVALLEEGLPSSIRTLTVPARSGESGDRLGGHSALRILFDVESEDKASHATRRTSDRQALRLTELHWWGKAFQRLPSRGRAKAMEITTDVGSQWVSEEALGELEGVQMSCSRLGIQCRVLQ